MHSINATPIPLLPVDQSL